MEELTFEQRNQPTIGIITALPKEYIAVKAVIDNPVEFSLPGRGAGRRYFLGEVPAANRRKHIIALSLANMGNNIAATRATLLLEHFPNINTIIMVGIAGGVPFPDKPDEHVRLGDIVVSNQNGVIQYDFDKETLTGTIHRHSPRPPSATLLEGVRLLEAAGLEGKYPWIEFIERAIDSLEWVRPDEITDMLANSADQDLTVEHPLDRKRQKGQPRIFVGPIASANKLLKNPIKRDELRDKFGVKAIEMEGSGIADATWNHEIGYLVVRGICDYCDTNKGDLWQEYAAIVAAAYVRSLLETIPAEQPNNGEILQVPFSKIDREPAKLEKPITYRARIRLVHVATRHHLHSHTIIYSHPDTSGEQQVTAFAGTDANDYWIIKGPHGESRDFKVGQPVEDGDVIRLEHLATRKNLHSQSGYSAPVVTYQQEVCAFGVNGVGDSNDNWRVEVDGGGTWYSNKKVRLIHVETWHALHSHSSQSHPVYTMGQQEVTCYANGDDNDWWYGEICN